MLGQTASSLGSATSYFALPLAALAVTGSTAWAGLVGTALYVGQVLFGLPAGVVVDRLDRRRVMLAAEAAGLVLYAALAVLLALGDAGIGVIIAVAFATGVASVFFNPAESASIKALVDPDDLPTALANNLARMNASSLLGGPVGGGLFQLARAAPFLANAASFLVSVISLARIRRPLSAPARDDGARDLRAELLAGLRFIAAEPVVRTVVAANMLGSLAFGSGLMALQLHWVQSGTPAAVVGVVTMVMAGCGLAGALLAPSVNRRLRPWQPAAAAGLAWCGALLWGAAQVPVAGIAAVLGVGSLIQPAGSTALSARILHLTPDALQGRVQSAAWVCVRAIPAAAPLLGGLLLQSGDLAVSFLALAAVQLVAVALFLTAGIRTIPRPAAWTAPTADTAG
ncbi:hypothetical protein BIV57_04230 [Mangrovactinospora gilvigrisea]|uniref:MFS transporter n=2 Tax=Mangrovactinospora gilvigrisea TaxID=1428644 RepID=A0A1J7BJ48_9ACTN|nr:hypothetical protein BIV57_04230 [Mangrovactinospora gilvigrisea]